MNTRELEPGKWMFQHFDYLTKYAKGRLSDEILIEDIVQDTFLAALRSVDNFRGESSGRTWLTSILKRKIVDQYRKNNTKKGKFLNYMIRQSDLEESFHQEISLDTLGNSNTYQAEQYTSLLDIHYIINDTKHRLSNKERQAFELKIIEGYDNETICEKLCVSKQNLWVLLHRARKKMKKKFLQEGFN